MSNKDFTWYKQVFNQIMRQMDLVQNQRDAHQLLLNMRQELSFEDKAVREYALKVSKYTKDMAAYMAKNTGSGNFDDVYWKILLLEAPELFDSYLLYLEKNRSESSKFYEPKREQLNKHGLILSLQDLEDDNLDLLSISMPPGTQKTTLEKFFTGWIIGRHPDDYNLFFSHSGDITRMFYDGVLDITTNSVEYLWSEIFPTVRLYSTDAKREQINFNSYKPFANLQCSSVGSKNAGKVRCNRYLLCDDLIGGIEEALNENRLNKLWATYSVDARQRKLNEQVKELHVATRWSVRDVIGRLKSTYGADPRKRFIAIPDIDPLTGKSNFEYKYNGMSVAFFRDQELLMDEISYKCLYKNEPIEREGLLYHEDDLRRYLTLPMEKPDAVIGICDTKDKGTDYLFLPCLLVYGSDYYCVDCICDNNSDYGVQYQRCADLIVKNQMQKVEFEHNSGGGRVAFDVAKLVEEAGHDCNITSKQTTGNKETKIIVNADWVKKHVLFKDKSMYTDREDYGVMMSWLLRYSIAGKNDHDDVPDGFAMLAEFVRTAFGAKVEAMHNPFWGG